MKVDNTGKTQGVSKSKKSNKSQKSSGVSFDQLVEKAGSVENVEAAEAAFALGSVGGVEGNRYDVPEDAKGRGQYMLDRLEDLEKDILSGNDSGAVYRLKQAIESQAVDIDQISPELRRILDEIEMRASVEIAKMEAANQDDD
ncbi:MAG: flagellar assembly protein FliX [Pseudomonadota bacterium]|nr:flagellar assembly protein FliX [Pseudomonadota bacterium]MEC8467248.1 flagellar assembly protein FliX [Pseudomonadota bacterium]